jgi:hypothetical protein
MSGKTIVKSSLDDLRYENGDVFIRVCDKTSGLLAVTQ